MKIQQQDNQILFTNKDNTIVYKTGMLPDPDLAQRLKDPGAEFSEKIIEQANPSVYSISGVFFLPIAKAFSALPIQSVVACTIKAAKQVLFIPRLAAIFTFSYCIFLNICVYYSAM